MSLQIFCQPLQQTLAIAQDLQTVVRADVEDSDSYFRAASRVTKPARDNTTRIG